MPIMKLQARLQYERAARHEIEALTGGTPEAAEATLERKGGLLWSAFEIGVPVRAAARLILDLPAAAPLTAEELAYGDALCRSMCREPSLDRLVDKWEDHGYRPTFRVTESQACRRLADLYDRRALERGIVVASFRM